MNKRFLSSSALKIKWNPKGRWNIAKEPFFWNVPSGPAVLQKDSRKMKSPARKSVELSLLQMLIDTVHAPGKMVFDSIFQKLIVAG